MSVTIECVGQRVYLSGNTFAIKDKIKSIGGHWDGDRKQWWLGAAKKADAERLVGGLTEQDATPKEDTNPRIIAKVRYKGRVYYASWEGPGKTGGRRAKVHSLDGNVSFYCEIGEGDGSGDIGAIVKWYEPRKGWGRNAREVFAKLSSIRQFVEQQQNPSTARGQCVECGSWGKRGELCRDCHEGHFA